MFFNAVVCYRLKASCVKGERFICECIYIYEFVFFSFFQLSVKTCFIRGSVVRYVQLPADECDTQLLQDAARKEAAQNKQR